MEELVGFLGQVPLFSSLPEEFKTILAQRLERREYARGDAIVHEGQPGESMFIIAEGLVSVVHEDEALGLQFELAQLRPGQVLGEMALLTRETRSATCRALEPTVAFELQRNVFASLLNRSPLVALGVCQILAQRVAELNRRQGIQVLDSSRLHFDPEVYDLLPAQLLQQARMIPLSIEGGRMTIATPEPGNTIALDNIRRCLPRVEIQPAMISETDYQRFVEQHLREGRSPAPKRPQLQRQMTIQFLQNPDDGKDTLNPPGDVVALMNEIIAEALDRNASDIHIEPTREGAIVRYRIDGQLRRREQSISRAMYRPLLSRLKVLAAMDIAERRLPQDGRIGLTANGRLYDIRLSTLPTKLGEKAALRLLDSHAALRPLDELILANEVNKLVRKLVHRPYGTVVVCGPTGSGKTTTLYSCLSERRSNDANITTIEDPIEFDVPEIVQVQVNEAVGLTFPSVLRTILRQDAEVILIGETRDSVTARMALEAGLSGHLVLTTLHANTSASALLRLREMGTDPYSITNALNGVICQRLVRRLCPACAKPTSYGSQIIDLLVQDGVLPKGFSGPLFAAPGCATCRDSGFKGRVGVYEVLTMTEPVRIELSRPNVTVERLNEAAQRGGYVPMTSYAAYLLKNGLTTPQEIIRILRSAESAQ